MGVVEKQVCVWNWSWCSLEDAGVVNHDASYGEGDIGRNGVVIIEGTDGKRIAVLSSEGVNVILSINTIGFEEVHKVAQCEKDPKGMWADVFTTPSSVSHLSWLKACLSIWRISTMLRMPSKSTVMCAGCSLGI